MVTAVERDWLTTAEIAARHHVTRKTVTRWILNGVKAPSGERVRLLATKIANEWRVKEKDLDAYLDQLRSVAPEELGESEAQFRRRAADAQRRVMERLGG